MDHAVNLIVVPMEKERSDCPTGPSDDPTTRGTHGYPSGTDGYPRASDCRPGGPGEPPDGPAEPPKDEDEEADEDPYWRRLGFSSSREFLDGLEAHQSKLDQWFQRFRSGDPPAASVPGDEIGELGVVTRRAPVRQVGIKLRPADYAALANAAFLYGVRPSTMARLLVNRGVRAVLEAHDGRNG